MEVILMEVGMEDQMFEMSCTMKSLESNGVAYGMERDHRYPWSLGKY
jgi:hypothetical protein